MTKVASPSWRCSCRCTWRLLALLLPARAGSCRRRDPSRRRSTPSGCPCPRRAGLAGGRWSSAWGRSSFPATSSRRPSCDGSTTSGSRCSRTIAGRGRCARQFERALALRLMDELGAQDVVLFPWWPGQRIDAAVELTVLAFETDADGMARLDAFWTMTRGRTSSVVGQGQARVREAVQGEGRRGGRRGAGPRGGPPGRRHGRRPQPRARVAGDPGG